MLLDCLVEIDRVAIYYSESGLVPARVYALCGEMAKAKQQLNVFNTFMRREMGKNLMTMGADQAVNMMKRYNEVNDIFAQLAQDKIDQDFHRQLMETYYNWQLQSKGLLLSLNSETEALYRSHPDPTIREMYLRLKKMEKEWTATTNQQSFEARMLQENISVAQNNLLHAVQQYIDVHGFAGVNLTEWQDVRSALRDREVAIEFACGKLVDDDEDTYYALLLRPDQPSPIVIRLFHDKDLTKLIGEKREQEIYDDTDNNIALAQLIMQPLEAYIRPGETVYFSAAGKIHQIALENMYYDEHRLLNDRYQMRRISSTRQLLARHNMDAFSQKDSIMLYGGIRYDSDTATIKAQSQLYPEQQLAHRAVTTQDINRGKAGPLPGALKEVTQLNQLLDSIQHPNRLLTDIQANEESFKALSGSEQAIIHIATHGFFWQKDSAAQYKYFASMNEDYALRNIDPMRRCGLLFAGANIALQGKSASLPEGVQDGVLTAQEISLMDLSNTKLVVLSACETGVGELNGDGVFGLQRAFKKAGVETLIMSLWRVSDQATQLLMTEFYKNWTSGQDKHTAFRNAQNTVRQRYEEPTYWAGFIMLD